MPSALSAERKMRNTAPFSRTRRTATSKAAGEAELALCQARVRTCRAGPFVLGQSTHLQGWSDPEIEESDPSFVHLIFQNGTHKSHRVRILMLGIHIDAS